VNRWHAAHVAGRRLGIAEARGKVEEAIERWKEASHTHDVDLYAECERVLAVLQAVRNDIAALASVPGELE
jgi:hypothetical protein